MKKINGNQITLLPEGLEGLCVRCTGHHLSFKTFHFLLFIFIIIYSTDPRVFLNPVALRHLHKHQPSMPRGRSDRTAPVKPPLKAHREPPLPFLMKQSGSILKDSGCKVEFAIWAVVWYDIYCVSYLLLVLINSIAIINRSKHQGYLRCVITCSLNKRSHQGTPDKWHDWRLHGPQRRLGARVVHCALVILDIGNALSTEQIKRGFGEWRRTSCVSNMFLFELCSYLSLMGDSEAFEKT